MKETKRGKRNLLGFFLLLIFVLFIPCLTIAQIPQQIGFQGYLTDTSGNSIKGAVAMTFRIYTTSSGGTALWQEVQAVAVNNGVYDVKLGANVPLTLPFDVPYYLGITVGADPEMTPRKLLTSVGYAFRASKVDGVYTKTEVDTLLARSKTLVKTKSAWISNEILANTCTNATGGYVTITPTSGTSGTIVVEADVIVAIYHWVGQGDQDYFSIGTSPSDCSVQGGVVDMNPDEPSMVVMGDPYLRSSHITRAFTVSGGSPITYYINANALWGAPYHYFEYFSLKAVYYPN